jgi:hypothetical protein
VRAAAGSGHFLTVEAHVVRYPVPSVFDLSQTDPTPRHPPIPHGDRPAGALDQLTSWLTAERRTINDEAHRGWV